MEAYTRLLLYVNEDVGRRVVQRRVPSDVGEASPVNSDIVSLIKYTRAERRGWIHWVGLMNIHDIRKIPPWTFPLYVLFHFF